MTDRIETTFKEIKTLLKHIRPIVGTFDKACIDDMIGHINTCLIVNEDRQREARNSGPISDMTRNFPE